MAAATTWFEGFAPDVTATLRRFPLAIAFAAVTTAAALSLINNWSLLPFEDWFRLVVGCACAAVCAVAGVFVRESRPEARTFGLIALYVVPVAFIGFAQVRYMGWAAPPLLLPVVALLWLSVSPVTAVGRGETRERQQNLFWWLNHQSIATALIAAAGFFIIAIGVGAIERSMFYLFGIDAGQIFYRWVLPFTGLFLTPVYWLSTLPKVTDYADHRLERPDFVAIAVGFLGQFVLVPLLLIYAAILLAYTGLIAVTWSLPRGTIGWMVLGFVVVGAGAWLVLHPPFMRSRPLVRLFRRFWFWLTLIPLALFFLAAWVRVDAYGLTDERVLLLAGGIWAALLTAVFIVGRGDIRLIPALAGVILLVLAVGPWNYTALPNRDQAGRLRALLSLSDPTGSVTVPEWNEEQVQQAAGSIHYLFRSDHGRDVLERTLLDHGIVFESENKGGYDLLAELGYPQTVQPDADLQWVLRDMTAAVDLTATPYYLGQFEAYRASMRNFGLSFSLDAGILAAHLGEEVVFERNLTDWATGQPADRITEPVIDFEVDGRRYRIVAVSASWRDDLAMPDDEREVTNLSAMLFADTADAAVIMPKP